MLALFLIGLRNGSTAAMGAGLFLVLSVSTFSRRARKDSYVSFITLNAPFAPGEVAAIKDNQKISVTATGLFSVSDKEAYLLQRPANYWRVPVGDHAIMVEHQPGRYMYQFIQPGTVQEIKSGFLIFGVRSHIALALTYLTTWGPEFADGGTGRFTPSQNGNTGRMQRTIYLVFTNDGDRLAVRSNLLRDTGKPIDKVL